MRVLPGVVAVAAIVGSVDLAAAAKADRKAAEAAKAEGDKQLAAGEGLKALELYERALEADPAFQAALDAAAPLWFANKQYDVAIARLAVAVKADPKYAMGWYNLAFAHRKKGENAEAVTGYQKFIELRPGEPDAYFGMGLAYKAMGERAKAKEALAKYVKLEQRPDKQGFVDKAKAELAALDKADAVGAPATPEAPVAAAKPEPTPHERAEAAKLAGDARREAKDLDGAERSYRAAIAADPAWAPPHVELGALLAARGKTADAAAEYERAVAIDPAATEAYYGLGLAKLALGDKAAAKAAFTKYVEQEKRPSEAKSVARAKAELAKLDAAPAGAGEKPAVAVAPPPAKPAPKKPAPGKPAPARPAAPAPKPKAPPVATAPVPAPDAPKAAPAPIAPLPRPVARQPGLITALPTPSPAQVAESRRYREQGDAAFAARKYDEALAAYRGAIAADPTSVDARYHLGVTLAARGELPAAIAAWEGVLLLDASHERARENIERARRKLPPAAAAASDDAATLTRARQLVDDGRWASALALLDGALADPRHADDPALLSLRAEARLGTGDASGAIVDWLSVLAIDPRFTRAYRGLADAYAVLGDTERADYYRGLAR